MNQEPSTSHLMVANTTHVIGSCLNSSPGAKQACNVKHINISISTTLCIFPPTCEIGTTWYHQQLKLRLLNLSVERNGRPWPKALLAVKPSDRTTMLGTCDTWKLDETETNMNHECSMYVYSIYIFLFIYI